MMFENHNAPLPRPFGDPVVTANSPEDAISQPTSGGVASVAPRHWSEVNYRRIGIPRR